MATVEDCEQALHTLAERMTDADPGHRPTSFERSLSCTLRDLGVTYTGRLSGGHLVGIAQAQAGSAQIKLTMTSDDLVAMVDGRLRMATAWATGRVKIEAGVRDILKLRSMF